MHRNMMNSRNTDVFRNAPRVAAMRVLPVAGRDGMLKARQASSAGRNGRRLLRNRRSIDT